METLSQVLTVYLEKTSSLIHSWYFHMKQQASLVTTICWWSTSKTYEKLWNIWILQVRLSLREHFGTESKLVTKFWLWICLWKIFPLRDLKVLKCFVSLWRFARDLEAHEPCLGGRGRERGRRCANPWPCPKGNLNSLLGEGTDVIPKFIQKKSRHRKAPSLE